MNPTDEELLHAFYAGDNTAVERLIERHDAWLSQIGYLILGARTGSEVHMGEWDVDQRLTNVWAYVVMTQQAAIGSWPHQRLSVLTWLIHLLCQELDRHLGFRGPF